MEQDYDSAALIEITQCILTELRLLTSMIKASAVKKFYEEFLATDLQRKIYEEFDGEKDAQAIAEESGASLRAAQFLIKELDDKDLIGVEKRGRSIIPNKEVNKIAMYYANEEVAKAFGGYDEQ